MTDLEPLLTHHPFFADLPKPHLDLVVGCAANVRFQTGDYLVREGQEADWFYLLRDGRVSLEIPTGTGAARTIQTLDDGDILGWSWLIPPYHWHFDARAVGPVRAIALDGKCLRAKCESDHDLGYALLKRFAQLLGERLDATRMQLLDLYRFPNHRT
ncbi:MAG: cyclic nucleotide-binding domain-containing protein [Armatimonadaceae bacterium]|jgi:CRP/FNR family cyclic AMP-dependent transcriptional regulator